MRLAWFSPMPPVRSGIATCSAELVAALRREHDIDVFVDLSHQPAPPADQPVRSAHDFVWIHRQRPYDLTVFQLGNSANHDFLWPYLFRYPGLAVLHDAHVHHARAAQLLREKRAADYRVEFTANEPAAVPDAAELATAGFDSFLHYYWPFTRLVCTSSRLTVVHGRLICEELRHGLPGARVEHVRLGHGTLVTASEIQDRSARARARHGIAAGAMTFGCFGGLTPDKRLPQVLDAFQALLPYTPSARLLLAGPEAEYYDVRADIASRGLESHVIVAGYVDTDEELTDCIAASDVTLNLRWPTAREVSGPWLRALAAGRPTIVIDLSHMADVPSIDPRTWRPNGDDAERPVAVAIDILDEDHSLRLAMRRLATDAVLREALGRAARDYWVREHSPDAMLADYRRVLPQAAAAKRPAAALPGHVLDDQSGFLQHLLGEVGVAVPWGNI